MDLALTKLIFGILVKTLQDLPAIVVVGEEEVDLVVHPHNFFKLLHLKI